MPRTRENCISYRLLVALQILSIIALSSITIRCSAEDDLLCSEGVCVPEYLCGANGTVNQDGEGLIDTRFQRNECPIDMVCCKLAEAEANSVWSEDTCDGNCVPASECEVALDSLDLGASGSECTGNNICCRNVPKACDGVCLPAAQCSDVIDLRLNIENCPTQQVCCRKPSTVNNYACKGKCVSPNQCSDYNPVRGLINLRYSNGNCPANQICCNNVKLNTKCDGLCLPRARCDDSGIDLRFDDGQCPNREICCQKAKSSGLKQDSITCNGICLPAVMCPNTAQTINLRIADGCPANEVCCDKLQLKGCDGTCTTLDQCADAPDDAKRFDLRLGNSECPNNKICCKKLRSDETECDGTCVPQRQCPELNTWKSVISLRSSENRCPLKQVCCKNPVFTDCDGKCVPQQQCNDDMKIFDLRLSAAKCPVNNVCCKNLTQSVEDSAGRFCDGDCVAPIDCPDNGSINTINLRVENGACPDKKICCKTNRKSNVCSGSCIPREQCDDRSIDLRFDGNLCSGSAVCCKRPTPLIPASTTPGSCDGTCLPRNQCSDKESINLRAFGDICPGNQICCKEPKQQSACDGTCAPLDQCLDSSQNINLRYTDGNCPNNQICCKNLKTPESTCNGKCVPASKCSKRAMSSDPVDLRFGRAACPVGEVCCQDLEVCDGICVPQNQCDDISISEGFNLRFGKPLCPLNQVCCKKQKVAIGPVTPVIKTSGSCDGTCLPRNQCLDKDSINLRTFGDICPGNQICCKEPKQQSACDGTCAPLDQCLDSSQNINLRFTDGSCPRNQICCKNLKTPESTCNGKCVPVSKCLRKTISSNPVDLRFGIPACPVGEVCCQDPEVCDGSCVPENQCDVNSVSDGINLRYGKPLCPINQVCCKKAKKCDGSCIPTESCPSVDLRLATGECPLNQVCCKTPEISETCQGICTQPKNCNDKLSILANINLRSPGGSCPQNEICCKNPKPFTMDVCDGICLSPKECSGTNIDLRSPDGKCLPNQVCCKTDTCSGTCVLSELCADIGVNLHYDQKKCPMNHVCCQKLKGPTKAACLGQCVLPKQCPNYKPAQSPIDLRLVNNGCPNGQICCEAQISFLPPSLMMGIPNPPIVPISSTSLSTALSSSSNCVFNTDPSAEYVAKTDVPWLATIWSRREILGIQHRQYECVGTLIKSDLVLTSADCLKGISAEQLYARVGDFNLKPLGTLSSRREINIADVTVHPDFDSKTGFANLAVLRLSKNATKGSSVCLPEKTELDPMALCFLVGWNKQNLINESIPNALPDKRFVALITSAKCDTGYICTDENQSKSQCAETFQGSPVICFAGSSRSWVQTGLTAGASKNCNALEVPHSFVSIASYEMWIKEQITPSCSGTCVLAELCADIGINLRYDQKKCPMNRVCCQKLKEPTKVACPGQCNGTCASLEQCLDSSQNVNLRYTNCNCPNNQICCKNLKTPESTCNGKCVPASQCLRKAISFDPVDLRFGRAACPVGEVCCQDLEVCDGSCVPQNQCDVNSVSERINLRYGKPLCPVNQVCCKKQQVLIEPLTSVTKTFGSCDGTCLPRNQCSDKESINLRAFDGVCPRNQICCKVPKQKSACDGTCAPLNQCLDSSQNINLRYTDGTCPKNEICCKNLKTPDSTCNGKCVPVSKCLRKAISSNPLDLRFGSPECPVGEVCCQDLEVCDGSCVPENQCDVNSVSVGINLRYGKPLCPINQVCCKKAKKCDGSCVPTGSCPSVDLRLATGECSLNQVCCKIPDISETCQGICTQPKNCIDKLSILANINLRSPGGSCPQNEICCKNPKPFTMDVCDGICVSPKECSGNNIDLRSPDGKCLPNQVCCKTDACSGTCVLSELCADIGVNLRYEQNKCPMNHVCCQKLKEPTKAACPGQCVLPKQCPNNKPAQSPIDLRLVNNGCSYGQICCEAQISILPPSLMMGIPNPPIVPISSTSLPTALSSSSNCVFSTDPSAEYVSKTDVPWLATIWSRREILGIQRHQYECVGTLIKSDLVLTSADCLKGLSTEQLYARVGNFNLKPLDTLSSRREINIADVTVHPDFDSKTGFANLAVLRLSKNATKGSSVCLPEKTELDPMALCFLVGWNKQNLINESIPNASPDKRFVALTTSAKCDEGYICSDENQSKSQCAEAFQGSPVICFAGRSRSWVQTGLTVGRSKKCNALEVPHSFVSIGSYEMWIKEQITPSFQQIKSDVNPLRTYLPPVA